jgi:hypothetical protein
MDAIEKNGDLVHQVLSGIPLFNKIKEKMKTRSGGALIRIPVEYGTNATVKSFEHYDQFTMQPTTPFTSAMYNWKAVGGVCMISGMEMRANNGPEELFDLWEGRYKNLIQSFQVSLNTMFHSDGSGNGYKDLLGLKAIVLDSGTLAGIDPTTNTWWKSKSISVGSAATYLLTKLREAWTTTGANVPELQPDLIISPATWYNQYEELVKPYEQFIRYGTAADAKQKGDLGFQSLAFKGAELTWDDACISTVMYMLNTRRLFLVGHKDALFKPTPKREMDDQDAWASKVIFQGELVTDCRRAHCLMHTIS